MHFENDMQIPYSTQALLDACVVLFGPEVQISTDFIHYLQPEGLRAAYRKKVLETHPDRALATGEDAARMKADFIRATVAYRTLSHVVMKNGAHHPNIVPNEGAAARNDSQKREVKAGKTEKFFTGSIPGRKLLLCQFLYYSGCISWNTYMKALVWQRRQRLPVGRIARDMGLLSDQEIQAILKQREAREKFGESAIRMGFLTPYKLLVLLGKQRRIKRRIGDYFVQSGILSRRQVESMAQQQGLHNKKTI